MSHRTYLLMFLVVCLVLTLVTCSQPSAQPSSAPTEERIVEVEKPVEEHVPEVEGSISFASWAYDDFEVWALETLVDQFKSDNPGVDVDLVIIR